MDIITIISSYKSDNLLFNIKNVKDTINNIYSTWFNKFLLGVEIIINLFIIINKYLCYYFLNNILVSSTNSNIILYFSLYFIEEFLINIQSDIINYNANLIYLNSQDKITKKIIKIKYDNLKNIDTNRIMNFNIESFLCGFYLGMLLSIPLYIIEIICILIFCIYNNENYLFVCLLIYILSECLNIYINIYDEKFKNMKNIHNILNIENLESYENIKYLKMKNIVEKQRESCRFSNIKKSIIDLNNYIFSLTI